MFAAILVSLALFSQVSGSDTRGMTIDLDYVPEVGDEATVGFEGRDGKLLRAFFATSPENYKALLLMNAREKVAAARLGDKIFRVNIGTKVRVEKILLIRDQDSKDERFLSPLIQIQVLDGPLQRKVLFGGADFVIRLIPGESHKATLESKSEPAFVLTDLTLSSGTLEGYATIEGRVRNNSDESFKFVRVAMSLEDSGGRLVKTESAFTDPPTVGPGETVTFSATTRVNPRVQTIKVNFTSGGKSIPWRDASGKNAKE
jgi:hypothetical protein